MKTILKPLFALLLLTIPGLAQSAPTAVGLTDKGITRDHNEDSFILFPEQEIYVVADGMGGHAAGEVASEMAVETAKLMVNLPVWPLEDKIWPRMRTNAIISTYHLANLLILKDSMSNPAHRGMGTTMVSAVVRGDYIDIINVGDSRAYRIRDGKMVQVSHDQSLVQQYIDEGRLKTQAEIDAFPYKNIITQAMGTQQNIIPDIFEEKIETGDIYVLCSDGLTNEVSDEEIAKTVTESSEDLNKAAQTLIDKANANGGRDNITVVLIQL